MPIHLFILPMLDPMAILTWRKTSGKRGTHCWRRGRTTTWRQGSGYFKRRTMLTIINSNIFTSQMRSTCPWHPSFQDVQVVGQMKQSQVPQKEEERSTRRKSASDQLAKTTTRRPEWLRLTFSTRTSSDWQKSSWRARRLSSKSRLRTMTTFRSTSKTASPKTTTRVTMKSGTSSCSTGRRLSHRASGGSTYTRSRSRRAGKPAQSDTARSLWFILPPEFTRQKPTAAS